MTDSKTGNEPVFPQVVNDNHLPGFEGMTKREYYAGQALIGICSQLSGAEIKDLSEGIKGGKIEALAARAIADAMIAAGESDDG